MDRRTDDYGCLCYFAIHCFVYLHQILSCHASLCATGRCYRISVWTMEFVEAAVVAIAPFLVQEPPSLSSGCLWLAKVGLALHLDGIPETKTRSHARLGLVCGCIGEVVLHHTWAPIASIAPLLLAISLVHKRWVAALLAAAISGPPLNQPSALASHALAIVATYNMVYGCPLTFTFGEAWVLSQGLLVSIHTVIHDHDTTTTLIAGSLLGLALLISLVRITHALVAFKWAPLGVALSVGAGIVLPAMHLCIKQNPLLYILDIFQDHALAGVAQLAILVGAIATMTAVAQWADTAADTIALRKGYHLAATVLLTPMILNTPGLAALSGMGALVLYLVLDVLRSASVPYVEDAMLAVAHNLRDSRDAGVLILTPAYLLIGCIGPLWLAPGSNSWVPLAGVISIGIGDTAAALVGKRYGRLHLLGSRKTAEGFVAAWLAQLGFLLFTKQLWLSETTLTSYEVTTLALVSALECSTDQIDNLVLPLYLYVLWTAPQAIQ
eukprot:m.154894 g.154894  ORF g.154894 m.154894 type:complete len:496 (+) comp16399_c0_seq4:2291-3778(+)